MAFAATASFIVLHQAPCCVFCCACHHCCFGRSCRQSKNRSKTSPFLRAPPSNAPIHVHFKSVIIPKSCRRQELPRDAFLARNAITTLAFPSNEPPFPPLTRQKLPDRLYVRVTLFCLSVIRPPSPRPPIASRRKGLVELFGGFRLRTPSSSRILPDHTFSCANIKSPRETTCYANPQGYANDVSVSARMPAV